MNESHDHFDSQLGRLLDDAAASFRPTPTCPASSACWVAAARGAAAPW